MFASQRRQDSALRRAFVRALILQLRKDSGFQERDDQPVDLRVLDPPAHLLHQSMVVDVVEASFDVPFNGPLIRESTVVFLPWRVRTQ